MVSEHTGPNANPGNAIAPAPPGLVATMDGTGVPGTGVRADDTGYLTGARS
jgi:hypothetical protein